MLISLLLLALVVYGVYRLEKYKKSTVSSNLAGGLSAFSKVAEQELSSKEAEGKIISLRAAAATRADATALLRASAEEVHTLLEDGKSELEKVHKLLG